MQSIPTFLKIQMGGFLSLFVVIYGLADFLLLPAHLNFKQTEQHLKELRDCAANLGDNLIKLNGCQKKFAEHRAHLDECYDSMESESLDPLEWLHNVSERSGLTIISFQDQRHGIVNALPAVDIDMKAHGTYEQICNFLHHLERSSRPCFISRFHIAHKFDESEDLEVEARFLVFPLSTDFQDLLQQTPEPTIASHWSKSNFGIPSP
jgi:Tfp pilus assembly protein PilO